ncbi:MAG: hypothetical protein RMJ59_04235 [Candidatus Nitrosocaldus sp.]|nr:hypothetical protein [Candidatus Nitrosocaldus sp.]MDW8275575.1 hypothetical protein [Candidatus Nitrosocaldus sp.]
MGKGVDTNYKKFAYNSNNIIKIATILQKSLNNGKCTSVEMKEVGRYIMHYMRMNLEECINGVEGIMENVRRSDTLDGILHTLQRMMQDIKSIPRAYEQMIAENGSVDKSMLTALVNVDNEMTSNLKLLNSHISSIKGSCSDSDIEELSFLVGEIELNIKERHELLKKLELKGQL